MEGYAIASAWLAALFVRTERCISARSRLTAMVGDFSAEQRYHLSCAGRGLVREALPELLSLLSELLGVIGKITKEIGVQVPPPLAAPNSRLRATRGRQGLFETRAVERLLTAADKEDALRTPPTYCYCLDWNALLLR